LGKLHSTIKGSHSIEILVNLQKLAQTLKKLGKGTWVDLAWDENRLGWDYISSFPDQKFLNASCSIGLVNWALGSQEV
jgi:hypothetical protein